jgi:hypothetical protein
MDFLVLLLLIVGVVTIVGVIMWLVSRSNNNKQREQGSHNAQHYEQPTIIRRPTETYTPPTNTSPQMNITGELSSLNTRLLSLENRMVILEGLVRMTYRGTQPSTPGHQKFDESPYPVASLEPVTDYPQPLRHTDFLRAAADSYQRLTLDGLRNLPLEPVFVYLDVDESARGAAVGESERVFKQSDNKQNAFVVFAKTDGDGWLFPNPRISYTESMGYVFPQLTFENFTDSKHGVDPLRVRRTGESTWETFRQ